jgi:hypothetical protein
MSTLPDVIRIDDVTSGKIEPELIYEELERLKVEINLLRNDMALFVKALATAGSNQSQVEYYRTVTSRLKAVQAGIKDYCGQYNKLLPIINLAQIRLGHEVEIVPQVGATLSYNPATLGSPDNQNSSVPTPNSSQAMQAPNTSANSVVGNKSMGRVINNTSKSKNPMAPMKPQTKQSKVGFNANQPILL